MTFQFVALEENRFSHFYDKDQGSLRAFGVVSQIVDKTPGYPCRVSLQDAEPGERVLLLNYEHMPMRSPFRASHAIYVRVGALRAQIAAGTVPEFLRCRTLSLRAFDGQGMMVNAQVTAGNECEAVLETLFADSSVDRIHVHSAGPGCFLAEVKRA